MVSVRPVISLNLRFISSPISDQRKECAVTVNRKSRGKPPLPQFNLTYNL